MTNLEQEILLGVVTDETLLEAEATLTTEEFQRYTFMAETQKKSDLVAWLLWIFLGTFQIHMVYLNQFNDRHQKVLRIVGLVLLYFLIGYLIIIPLWIYDAIKMSSYIKEANNMEKAKILNMFIAKNNAQQPINAEVVEKESNIKAKTIVKEEPVAVEPEIVEQESRQNAETIAKEEANNVEPEVVEPEIVEEENKNV